MATAVPTRARPRRRRAFTLIETGLVTVVIGVSAVATLQLMAAGTMSNDTAAEMTVAVNLANNARDLLTGLPLYDPQAPTSWLNREATVAAYDNVTDFDGLTFSPPLDPCRTALSGYGTWSQVIDVQSVGEDNLATTKTDSAAEKTARVTVSIKHGSRTVYVLTWVVADTVGG